MSTIALDKKLIEIASLEKEKTLLEESISKKREQLVELLEKDEIKSYKNTVATVSYVQRKDVVFTDKEATLSQLEDKYIEVIPARKEINKRFIEEIKDGYLKFKGVEVVTKEFPQIRFAK